MESRLNLATDCQIKVLFTEIFKYQENQISIDPIYVINPTHDMKI